MSSCTIYVGSYCSKENKQQQTNKNSSSNNKNMKSVVQLDLLQYNTIFVILLLLYWSNVSKKMLRHSLILVCIMHKIFSFLSLYYLKKIQHISHTNGLNIKRKANLAITFCEHSFRTDDLDLFVNTSWRCVEALRKSNTEHQSRSWESTTTTSECE